MMPRNLNRLKASFPYRLGSRALSSSKTSSHTRLAGRTRFYKHVGTTPISPPWKTTTSSRDAIDSPISAGVDGTNSASGVVLSTRDYYDGGGVQMLLHPRNPKTNELLLPYSDDDDDDWFGVTLDGKIIKTPLGRNLAVPSHILAWAIAAEWDFQKKLLQPAQMPLMTLCCTAMDQVSLQPESYKEQILRYLPTDTTCYWADPSEDRILHKKQQQAWEGLHDYCQAFLQARPSLAMGTTEGVIMSRSRRAAVVSQRTRQGGSRCSGLPHPPELILRAKQWVDTLDAWHLTALHSVASESKSFLVGMALVLSSYDDDSAHNPFHDVTRAVAASRVEEEFQIGCWGLVEGGHDYDRLNCSVQIHAARFLTGSLAMGKVL